MGWSLQAICFIIFFLDVESATCSQDLAPLSPHPLLTHQSRLEFARFVKDSIKCVVSKSLNHNSEGKTVAFESNWMVPLCCIITPQFNQVFRLKGILFEKNIHFIILTRQTVRFKVLMKQILMILSWAVFISTCASSDSQQLTWTSSNQTGEIFMHSPSSNVGVYRDRKIS